MNSTGAIEAEQSVLGAVFLDPSVLDEITFLEPRDFSGRNRRIYEVMRYLDNTNKPVDLVTVTEEYHKFGRVDEMGGVSYLMDLANSCPSAASVLHYAKIVRSKAVRRRGHEAARKLERLADDHFDTDEEYFSEVENLLSEVRPQDQGKMVGFKETRAEYFKHLNSKASTIPTGFKQFDEWSKGLGRGQLFVSAGRPSVGKTAKLLQRLYGVAKTPNVGPVLLYSQEMGMNEIKDRMIAGAAGIHYPKLIHKRLSDNDYARVEEMYDQFEDLPIFVQDSAGVTIDEIKATARQFKRRYGKIALIAVDYLQIMSIPKQKGETRAEAIGRVTGAAKQISRDMDCCFMMLSQMSRASEQKSKPQLSDLKESGSIEQDADVVEFLWHDPNDWVSEGKVIQQFIAKGRNIGINEFRLLFKGWRQSFEELPKKVKE